MNETAVMIPLSPQAISAFNWLRTYADESGLSRQELADRLGYDESTISKIVNHRYLGNTQPPVERIEKFRASLISRIESAAEFPFVESQVARTIHSYVDLAAKWRKIGILIAESQTGKTRSLKAYRNAKRIVIYLRLPAGGHRSKTVLRLCEQLDVSDKYNTPQREKRLMRAITRDHLIIIDELQQCASRPMAGGRIAGERIETIEWLRDLKDETGCGMVFSGTTEALRMLKGDNTAGTGGHESGHILIQTLKRSLDPLIIPNKPPKRDMDAYARKIGLPPAEDEVKKLQDEQVAARGLEIWLTYLLAGAEIASGEGRAVTWSDVTNAHAIFTGGAK